MEARRIFGRNLAATNLKQYSFRPRPYDTMIAFYRRPFGWVALAFTALTMVYVGGAGMFWFHSIFLGEGGPAINPVLHWFVDSSVGLFALTPVLFVILPILARYAIRSDGSMHATRYILLIGAVFALTTAPGPVAHDTFVGKGTWLANKLTSWWGDGRITGPGVHLPVGLNMLYQVLYGLPLYTALMALTFLALRRLAHATMKPLPVALPVEEPIAAK